MQTASFTVGNAPTYYVVYRINEVTNKYINERSFNTVDETKTYIEAELIRASEFESFTVCMTKILSVHVKDDEEYV